MTRLLNFIRRRNPDATIDSICESCYQTIATDRDEENLRSAEQRHSCDPNAELDRTAFARHATY
jgi:hypothetical protein